MSYNTTILYETQFGDAESHGNFCQLSGNLSERELWRNWYNFITLSQRQLHELYLTSKIGFPAEKRVEYIKYRLF